MWPVSCRTLRCGRLARDRCRRRNGRAAVNDQSAFVATTSINRYRSKSSLSASPSAPGAGLNGGRGRPRPYRRALLACGFVSHIEITHSRKSGPKCGRFQGEQKPAKYWLSALPKNIPFHKLADLTKLRWRIERD